MLILKNAKGQISIFFATTVLVLITFIAFIVNIGVFVKAKMNLQNAVDASAYAGAAVQARQLTNIAYLNWEMRNVYKEWMFKYYVLGNITLGAVENGASGGFTDFRMESYSAGTNTVFDNYNIPSVCVDFEASGNVTSCRKAMVPGLPRFARTDVLGLEETMDTFVDSLSAEKAKDCAIRTSLNFYTNFVWAYNVTNETASESYSGLVEDAPDVATNRPGAFPSALELAFRIRQLERQVNRAPYSGGVCLGGGTEGCNDGGIDQLVGGDPSPSNERVYKAFYSGFRNLGSADCSGEGDGNDEFKCFYTMTELAPTPYIQSDEFSPSNTLIPAGKREKHYLDLKLQYINFATFFTMLAPNTTGRMNPDGSREVGAFDFSDVGANISAESTAECVSTKVAMPIPAYPLGFVKNPDVMTYYAVKAHTQFLGRFSPFTNAFKLTAFSAAKPFGGRIGPMIVDMNTGDEKVIKPRTVDLGSLKKSTPYMSRLDLADGTLIDRFGDPLASGTAYAPGVPIPLGKSGVDKFFAQATDSIGGIPPNANDIYFVIPNIPYDFPGTDPNNPASYFSDDEVQVIRGSEPDAPVAGLYNPDIFNKLRANLNNAGGNTIRLEDIEGGVYKARAPTRYDAHHYLVPTPESVNNENSVDSYGIILNQAPAGVRNAINQPDNQEAFMLNIYAPLVSPDSDALYSSVSDIKREADDYLKEQEVSVLKYKSAMNIAAFNVSNANLSSRTGGDIGLEASQLLSDFDPSLLTGSEAAAKAGTPGCLSLNGKFVFFYIGNGQGGSAVNTADCKDEDKLISMLERRWNDLGEQALTFYQEVYVNPASKDVQKSLFSAYRPTPMNDADDQGVWTNTLTNRSINKWRNYYSTKFVTLKSLSTSDDNFYTSSNFTIFSEGNNTNQIRTIEPPSGSFQNKLQNNPAHNFSRISH